MTTSALRLALRGLFSLSPITLAVQGLIEQIQEEQRQQVYGNGRHKAASEPARKPQDDDLVRLVREKWDAIEQAQEKDRKLPAQAPVTDAQDRPQPAPSSSHQAAIKQAVPVRIPLPAMLAPKVGQDVAFPPASSARLTMDRIQEQRDQDEAEILLALLLSEVD